MNDNFITLLEALKSFSDLVSAEVRFAKNDLFSHKTIHENFRANTKIDVFWRAGPAN